VKMPGGRTGRTAMERSAPPGSTSWEHSRGPHMSHQKRNNLLEGRVRDTSARVVERQPERRIPVPLALHHQDFRVRAGNKVNEREGRIRGGTPSLHFARELFQIDVSELNSVIFVDLSGQIDHVEVIVDCHMET